MPAIVDQGIPVVTSRQFSTALSPNAAGTGWNYIVSCWPGNSGQIEWPVVKDLTTAPSDTIYLTPTHHYPNTLYQYTNQLRAANGRIFFPTFGNYTSYYDPTTEQVHEIGPVVEVPPIDPNASTIFYKGSFDVGGLLYFSTQESQNRPCMLCVTNTATLVQTVLGYVGDSQTGYTTYGYYIAPDTITATKYIYVAYGQSPWQLWALNITPGPNFGVATKLYEVPSTGVVQFSIIAGQGWIAQIHTALGSPSDVYTQWWCLDGAIYPYTAGQPPPVGAPATRNVTPASNPLVSPPEIDTSFGSGVVGWRFGSSGPYDYVNYTINNVDPIRIEALVASNDGVVGNAQSYQGFFQYYEPGGTHTYFGLAGAAISSGPRLNVDGIVYMAGYPNGVFYSYDPDAPWQNGVNPTLLGNFGLNGTQFAGIKYSNQLAWAPLAGATGRMYCAGRRERNGVGAGIGSWDKTTHAFAGTYSATGMDTVNSDGLVVLGGLSRVVMSTALIAGVGTAKLYVFDYDFNLISTLPVINGLAALGSIFETNTPNVITGLVQGSGNSVGLWQYNVETQTFIQYVERPIIGVLGAGCQRPGGSVWFMSGNNLCQVDINTLVVTVVQDLSSAAPVSRMSFASDPGMLFFNGGVNDGVSGAQLFSIDLQPTMIAEAGVGIGVGMPAVLNANGTITMAADSGHGLGIGEPVTFRHPVDTGADTGANTIRLLNDEGSTLFRGQPVYSDAESGVRLAAADNSESAIVSGLVADASIAADDGGSIRVAGLINAEPAEWDAVCGTTGGLTFNTVYYLHPSIPGRLTAAPPSASGTQLVPVIRALSSTQASIVIRPPILIPL